MNSCGVAPAGGRRPVQQRIEDLAHAEVVDRGTEEHRGLDAGQEVVQVEWVRCAMHQLDFHFQLFDFQWEHLDQLGVVDALDDLDIAVGAFLASLEQHDLIAQQVVHATEILAHADGPGHRRALDLQHRFQLIQQFQRIARFAVHLVHEGDDGRIAHAADVEQLDGLLFHALGRVDHHQRRVDRGQHAVGIFREVLVARGVEQVHHVVAVFELHHRAGYRDAALLFDLHPVRSRMAAALACLDGARQLDCAREQQQLFSQRGLARVRVGDDAEGAAALHFARDQFGRHLAVAALVGFGGRIGAGDVVAWFLHVGYVGSGRDAGETKNGRPAPRFPSGGQ
jgi:hypothetical protein